MLPPRHWNSAAPIAALCAVTAVVMGAAPAAAQADSVTVAAGEHYAAGALKERLLGRDYRDLWTAPITVPILDLSTFAGGLTPVQRGAGLQTISLRFRAPDGREFNFRSVDKDQTGGLHPDFRETVVDRLAQDQVSSKHPASAILMGPLLDAARVMHPEPALYVMPDDPRLGEFRETFAGMLGMLEIHPNEGENDEPFFHGAVTVAGTERLLERLEESAADRVDARAYLRARLVDLLVGDWDRHMGQWRWARYDSGGVRWWTAVPEDRDNAFSSYDGLLMDVIRGRAPRLVEFGPEYPDLIGLVENAQVLDRRLLSGLPRSAFDSVAAELVGSVTDAAIDAAVAATAPEYTRLRGREIADALRARRDALPAVAIGFYEMLAGEVEIRGTDEPDLAIAEHAPDGTLEVRLHSLTGEGGDPPGEAYFSRRFLPGETREVRIFLHGGDDRAIVQGVGPARVLVRIVGGGGDDVLTDATAGAGRPVTFYDHRGENTFERGPRTRVDTREFDPPSFATSGFNENAPELRDWGAQVFAFEPTAAWRYNVGPVIGGGPRVTRYGFRRAPHAHTMAARVLWAPLETRFGIEAEADVRRTNSPSRASVRAWATQLDVTRFHGYGNDTPADGPSGIYKILATDLGVEPVYHRGLGWSSSLFAGPIVRYTWPELEDAGPAAAGDRVGASPFARIGAQAGATADVRDLPSYPRHGARATVTASAFAGAAGLPGAFSALDARVAAYLPLPLPLETTLAVRAGGRRALGDFPIQEAAFVGGSETLRGHPRQRWAGDASIFAGAELRSFVSRFNFISRGDMGVIVLGDAGRVYLDGDSPGGWHTGVGGGVWFGILDRTRTFSIVAARGEETAVYLTLGMPF